MEDVDLGLQTFSSGQEGVPAKRQIHSSRATQEVIGKELMKKGWTPREVEQNETERLLRRFRLKKKKKENGMNFMI